MLIGIDWGGTKIEGVAITEDGKELTRRREPTPRHDYNGCIQLIAGLVQKIEQETGKTGSIGIGIPGSLDPKSRLGKGASSTPPRLQIPSTDLRVWPTSPGTTFRTHSPRGRSAFSLSSHLCRNLSSTP